MKQDHIPTRRQPVRKTLHSRFFNHTKPRKQRATAAPTMDDEESSGFNISRSLSIIFLIHIIALCMIFVHKQYLSGRTAAPATSEIITNTASSSNIDQLPTISNGDGLYKVQQGDTFATIATKYQIVEADLRSANPGAEDRPGVTLRIPKAKRIIAPTPPEVAAINENAQVDQSEAGLVEILPPTEFETPQLVRPNIKRETLKPASQTASNLTHTVKSGENIWRISTKYQVNQKKLMEINGIKDPTKLRIGQVIKIP